jgi:hypothetical protein
MFFVNFKVILSICAIVPIFGLPSPWSVHAFFQGGAGCLTSLQVRTFNARITAINRPCSAFGGQSNVQ